MNRRAGEKKRGGNEAVGDKIFSWRRQCVKAAGRCGATAHCHYFNETVTCRGAEFAVEL